jgi:hypothetical protein
LIRASRFPNELFNDIIEHETSYQFITGDLLKPYEFIASQRTDYLWTQKVHTQYQPNLQKAAPSRQQVAAFWSAVVCRQRNTEKKVDEQKNGVELVFHACAAAASSFLFITALASLDNIKLQHNLATGLYAPIQFLQQIFYMWIGQ